MKTFETLNWAYFTLGKGFDESLEHQERQMFVVKQLDDDAKAFTMNLTLLLVQLRLK